MSLETFVHVIAFISVACFVTHNIPDMIAAIKAKTISGVTTSSLMLLLIGLSGAAVTNLWYGNYWFVANDLICIVFNAVLLYFRATKSTETSNA